jgi:outer membrane protein OmpA-like peptidoglycan-associated protein
MSLLTDLFSTLDKRSLSGIGDALGETGQTVSGGMQGAIATLLGGLATKSDNPTFLRKMLDLVPSGLGNMTWSNMASGIADPNSTGMTTGRNMLSTMFGGSENMITQALGTGVGMRPSVISSLLAMAAPMVMSFLGRRVRDQEMNMGGLGNLLQREVPAIREALPAGVTDLLWPRVHETVATSPVVAQTVTRERSSAGWLLPLVILALIPGLIWLFSHGRRPVVTMPPVSGTANRAMPEVPVTPVTPVTPTAPNVNIHKTVNLIFDTGSSRLTPASRQRLNELESMLAADPRAHVDVEGYTDNRGRADSNMRLSQARANAVKEELIRRGIAADRLTVNGNGQEKPVGDNATAEGRGQNRHVTVEVGGD